MFEKLLILLQWEKSDIASNPNSTLQRFLKNVNRMEVFDWKKINTLLRKQYYSVFDIVVPPVLMGDNAFLSMCVIQTLQPQKRTKERNMLTKYIEEAAPEECTPMLMAIAGFNLPSLDKALEAKPNLPDQVNAVLLKRKQEGKKKSTKVEKKISTNDLLKKTTGSA